MLRDRVPQGHKVALADVAAGAPVLRYGIPIGLALKDIPAGSWVHERLLQLPAARSLDGLPIATVKPAPLPALDGYTFEGYRNADGSVGTRNILAITQTVQCVAGVTAFAVQRQRPQAHLGRALEIAKRAGAVQSGAGDLRSRGHWPARRDSNPRPPA